MENNLTLEINHVEWTLLCYALGLARRAAIMAQEHKSADQIDTLFQSLLFQSLQEMVNEPKDDPQ